MRLCKVCQLGDWHNSDTKWQGIMAQIAPGWREGKRWIHRKMWEWTQGIYGLQRLGCVKPLAVALSVGAGHEWPLYWMANQIQRIYATDLYRNKAILLGLNDDDSEMLSNPDKFAPFPYRRQALVVQEMDGTNLTFANNSMDFVFSFSSIEHFGGHSSATRAMQEMARVLKPGGIAAIATELILNGQPNPEYFHPHEIYSDLIFPSGMRLVEPIDFSFDKDLVQNAINIGEDPVIWRNTSPHIAVRIQNVVFTSIMFFVRKPGPIFRLLRSTRNMLLRRSK